MDENNSKAFDKYHDIILFDGVCNLCNHAVIFVIDRDAKKRFRFASLQSSVGQDLLKRFQLPFHAMNSLVLIRNDKAYLKSTGALEIARKLQGLWSLAYFFIIIPSPIRDFIYDIIAKYRYKMFGKSESCRYPSEELKLRFIDN